MGELRITERKNEEFVKKQEAMSKNYQAKLQSIDKSISDTIAKYAQENGYSAVFTKDVLLYGGTDITEDIKKKVK